MYLAFYMLLITFVFAANFYYFEHNYKIYSLLHSLHIASVLAIYPGAFIYVKLLVNPGKIPGKLWVHFIPSLFFLVASAAIFYPALSFEERVHFLTEYRYRPDFSDFWLKILYGVRMANVGMLFIQVIVYPFLTLRTLKIHKKALNEIFSNPEKYQMNWLKLFNYALALSALICVFIYSVSPQKLFGDERFLAYPLMLIAVILWFLGIMGNNQKYLVMDTHANEMNEVSDVDTLDGTLISRLIKLFEQDKIYLDPDLKIWDVARHLGSNRTYVSRAINSRFKQNFAAYVNGFRAKEARKLILEKPYITTEELVTACGFGSPASLSRAFKDVYDCSFTTFKKTA